MNSNILSVLKALHEVSGFRISLHDMDFNEIAAYPEKIAPFCALVQKNPQARQCCLQADRAAFQAAAQTGEPYLYQCRFGLFEAVSPLYNFGVPAGYLMMGQVLRETEKKDVLTRAAAYCTDAKLPDAVAALAILDANKIGAFAQIMTVCAQYLTLSNAVNPPRADLAESLKQYIAKNYAQKISIPLLCAHFHYSKSTVISAFENAFSISINRFLTQTRIEQAKKLLSSTDASVYQIAAACGFPDQSYFSRVFTRETGLPPGQFRKRAQQAETHLHYSKDVSPQIEKKDR